MQVQQTINQEVWVQILSKGIITIPKKFREILGLQEGEIARARIEGRKLVIEPRETKEYRLYSKKEIASMVQDDQLPEPQASEVEKYWSDIP